MHALRRNFWKQKRCDDGTVTEMLRTEKCGAVSDGTATASPDGTAGDCARGASILEVGGEVILSPEIPNGQTKLVSCPGGGQIAVSSANLCTVGYLSLMHHDM